MSAEPAGPRRKGRAGPAHTEDSSSELIPDRGAHSSHFQGTGPVAEVQSAGAQGTREDLGPAVSAAARPLRGKHQAAVGKAQGPSAGPPAPAARGRPTHPRWALGTTGHGLVPVGRAPWDGTRTEGQFGRPGFWALLWLQGPAHPSACSGDRRPTTLLPHLAPGAQPHPTSPRSAQQCGQLPPYTLGKLRPREGRVGTVTPDAGGRPGSLDPQERSIGGQGAR